MQINNLGEMFGFNNDFTAYVPINGSEEGLLWVNHESLTPEFLHKKPTEVIKQRTKKQIDKEMDTVGGSILHVKKQAGEWSVQANSKWNRRLSGKTMIPFSHGLKIQGKHEAMGTLANCAGGLTPWNTFLTSEENYDDFYGDAHIVNGKRVLKRFKKFQWDKLHDNPPEHYGWIVEIDPWTGKAEKQILLGRAPHEGATVTVTASNKAVVYMGEDRENGYIFKFVSTGKHFKEGTLYAANTEAGEWLPLDINKSKVLKSFFKDQTQVLTYAHQAAELLGATPQDRPEDIEIHPHTGDVFIALTKNHEKNNPYGKLLKISQSDGHESTSFKASTWLSGGPETGLACPDNLSFDPNGNLWITVDMAENEIGTPGYEMFGNNGLYFVPTSGPDAGKAIQIASAPVDAELTGLWFTPDYKTLFLAVQHPGAGSRKNYGKKKLSSDWPSKDGKDPRSAVVTIQGPLLDQLI